MDILNNCLATLLHLWYIYGRAWEAVNVLEVQIGWTILPRGDVAPHWSRLYVTINRSGALALSSVTHERLGSPEAVLIMFDRFKQRLGLKPAKLDTPNAYPLKKYGRRGAKIIRAYRLITEFGIRPPDTLEFHYPRLDADGNLILDLRKVSISPKAHSQCRRKPKQ